MDWSSFKATASNIVLLIETIFQFNSVEYEMICFLAINYLVLAILSNENNQSKGNERYKPLASTLVLLGWEARDNERGD